MYTSIFVKFFNWISYSNPNHICMNSQYLLHITSTDLTMLSLAMSAPQKQMWGHRPQHSHHHLNNNYAGPHTYWSNEPFAWYAASWAHHINNLSYLYYQWVSGSLLKWTAALPCHLIKTVSLEQTHFNAYQGYHHEESYCFGHIDLNEMCKLQVTVTGHSQVIVTSAWANNPTLLDFPTQNLAFIQFNRWDLRATGSCMVMSTIHTFSIPPWGLHIYFFIRKDRYQSLPSLAITNHSFIPIPAILLLPFSFLLLSSAFLTAQQLPQSISPQMLSLSMPWPHTTLQ